jgi:hypothetical protein
VPVPPGRAITGDLTSEESRRLRRSLQRWLVVVVVLVAALTSVVNWVFVDREPQDPVETWLEGLQAGRSRQLLSRAEAVVADPALGVFSNRVYRGAAGRLGGHEVLAVDQQGTRAEVSARVWWDDPGGGRREEVHRYRVHQVRLTGPFNDQWELDSLDAAPLAVHLPAPLDELSVNGESVDLDAGDREPDPRGPGGTWRFEALPGEYAIGLPGDSYYEVADPLAPVTMAFRDPRPAAVELRPAPSPRMWQETEDRIRAWLEECMEAEELAPERCPSSRRSTGTEPTGPEITDVEWRLLSRPALVLTADPGDPLRWNAGRHRPAVARLSYRENGERVVERVEFPVRATVRSTGGSAEISVGPPAAEG